jgi:hypothetical protein
MTWSLPGLCRPCFLFSSIRFAHLRYVYNLSWQDLHFDIRRIFHSTRTIVLSLVPFISSTPLSQPKHSAQANHCMSGGVDWNAGALAQRGLSAGVLRRKRILGTVGEESGVCGGERVGSDEYYGWISAIIESGRQSGTLRV